MTGHGAPCLCLLLRPRAVLEVARGAGGVTPPPGRSEVVTYPPDPGGNTPVWYILRPLCPVLASTAETGPNLRSPVGYG